MASDDTALLTIVIPTYNRKELLLKAVNSVIDQQVPRLIIHIYDNCSTDGTDKMVQTLMGVYPNISYTQRKSNIGSLANYSDAIRSVKTPFLMSLADDDWLLAGGMRLLLDTILCDETLGAVVSQTIHQNEQDEILTINPGNDWEYKRYSPQEFIPLWVENGHFEWSSIIFRREALEVACVPDISTDLVWDVDLQLQVFSRFPVKLLKSQTAVYLIHSDQSSRQVTFQKFLGQLTMLERAIELSNNNLPVYHGWIIKFLNDWFDRLAYEVAYHASIKHFLMSIFKICKGPFEDRIILRYVWKWTHFKLRIMKSKFIPRNEIP